MSSDALIHGYAQAMLSVAEGEGALDKVEGELFDFARALEAHPELREALTDSALPAENRMQAVRDLLRDRVHPVSLTLIGFVVEAGHAKDLSKIIDALSAIAAAARQHQVAEVRSAVELTDEQRRKIADALSAATGRKVEVKVVIDKAVVGGILARVGDLVFDGSIASRLVDAKQHLGS